MKRWIKRLPLLAAALALDAAATEGGGSNYLPGFYGDFGMALMPEQGTFFNNFFAAWQDSGANTGGVLEMPGIFHVTDWTLFGGRYSVAVYPALAAAWDYSGKDALSRFGLGDAYLVPAAFNWKWADVALLAFEGIVAPTGYYQKGAVNAGRNVWTFDHVAALTWNLPARMELSVIVGYMNNLENHATGYTSGDEFHFDYTVGHYLLDDLALGVTGSYYRQTTADQAPPGAAVGPYSTAATIGPAIMFTPRIADRDVTMSVKWLHEFNVNGRAAQDYLVWRVLVEF